MPATPSGDTQLCVDYDNYSPRYSPTVIANVMNNVMNVRTRASATNKSAYLLRYVKSTVPTLLYRVGYPSKNRPGSFISTRQGTGNRCNFKFCNALRVQASGTAPFDLSERWED